MKTITYTVGQSAANFGDTDGVNVEASLKKYCSQLQARLNDSLGDMADGYHAAFIVVPVATESDEGTGWDGDEMECWTEHTDTLEWIDREIQETFSRMEWVVYGN